MRSICNFGKNILQLALGELGNAYRRAKCDGKFLKLPTPFRLRLSGNKKTVYTVHGIYCLAGETLIEHATYGFGDHHSAS